MKGEITDILYKEGCFTSNQMFFYPTTLPYLFLLFLGLIVCLSSNSVTEAKSSAHPLKSPSQKVYKFANGKWFDGKAFQHTTFYVRNGLLTKTRPSVIDEVINLDGRFVLPPFGEAHTHNVEGPWNIDQTILNYLSHGIFYVKNPNSIREFSEKIREKINTPQSIDVVFAHAGLTSREGHPVALYEDLLRLYRYEPIIGKKERGWFKNRGYFTIDSRKDLDRTWPRILSGKPDFIKIYVGHPTSAATNHDPTTPYFRRGLSPDLIPPIVNFAHKDGLRVTAHVETAADFREAVLSGVDEIAHTPGWYVPTKDQASETVLRKQDAQLAAHHHVTVITTTVASLFHPSGHHQSHSKHRAHSSKEHSNHQKTDIQHIRQTAEQVQIQNLQLLHQQGVKIAVGSDHAETSLTEALHLHDLGIFDNLTLLKLWCENTAETIFPHRKIGKLTEGYEASFIVLQGNPIQDFQQIRHITLRVKQGIPLVVDHNPHSHE